MINGTKQSRLCAVKSSAEERQRELFQGNDHICCKDINADTYLITTKGIGLIKESEHGGKENVKE